MERLPGGLAPISSTRGIFFMYISDIDIHMCAYYLLL
jgi:hypothetical protein